MKASSTLYSKTNREKFGFAQIDPSAFRIHKDWDEYLTGGPYYIYGKRGSQAELFAKMHPFIFKENIEDEHRV